MADRFPLVIDVDDNNKIKELPNGDNLNLEGNSIINTNDITANGTIDASFLTENGQPFATVAKTGSFDDLTGIPTLFSGDYEDLFNKPHLVNNINDLMDVDTTGLEDSQALLFNDVTGKFEPSNILTEVDLSEFDINELNDVIITGTVTNKYLKFTNGAWRASAVNWNDVQSKPDVVLRSELQTIDIQIKADITGSVFADDSTVLVDGVNGSLPYTPDNPSNWLDPSPGTIGEAIDRLAAAVAALGGTA